MAVERPVETSDQQTNFDVLIVGAGISGIDAAYHLQQHCPDKRFVLLEGQESFGGTWRTHTYPGIRSDSDLYTFGYRWKPWSGPPIASAAEILNYLDAVLDEQNLRQHIRFRHNVTKAQWCAQSQQWRLAVHDKNTGQDRYFHGRFLWMCQGYYRHDRGYTPDFEGLANFTGTIVHPQTWPKDLDYTDKQVVVIGSGATAATLIPAMADRAGHITMLQRSPTYYFAKPNRNQLADTLRDLEIPEAWTHEIVRRSILKELQIVTRRSFEDAENLRDELIESARAQLGPEFDVDKHFTPHYRPWQQRLALIPDGDLFKAIRAGKVSVVTDTIDHFTETGIKVTAGQHLPADIVVTATGFHLSALGDIPFEIDGQPLRFADCWAHRGIMFTGIPNMAWVFGYLRSSWTLRADMISEFVCRLLNHMDKKKATVVVPQLRASDQDMQPRAFIEDENFSAGYLKRKMHLMPKQGDRSPWIFSQDYYFEKDDIPNADLEDGTLIYS